MLLVVLFFAQAPRAVLLFVRAPRVVLLFVRAPRVVAFSSEILSCATFRSDAASRAFVHPLTASCASVRNGLSCAFLRTGRRYKPRKSNVQMTLYEEPELQGLPCF